MKNTIRTNLAFNVTQALEAWPFKCCEIVGVGFDTAKFAIFDMHLHRAGAVAITRTNSGVNRHLSIIDGRCERPKSNCDAQRYFASR